MTNKRLEKMDQMIEKWIPLLIIITSSTVIIIFVIKGFQLFGFQAELAGFLLIGIGFVLFLLLLYALTNQVMNVWGKITEWIIPGIRKYPILRLLLIIPNIIIGFFIVYSLYFPLKFGLFSKIIFPLFLIILSPASIISLAREDLKKEETILAEKVSRSVRIDNPQAAIQNAFTHFEDHLNKRIQGGEKLFSSGLIKAAYDGENSKLEYKIGDKDHTQHVYQLMAGAYSLLRNPRHHKIIEDSEEKAQVIIALTELLMEFVDESEDRMAQIDSN